jgi:hypothetical protein
VVPEKRLNFNNEKADLFGAFSFQKKEQIFFDNAFNNPIISAQKVFIGLWKLIRHWRRESAA